MRIDDRSNEPAISLDDAVAGSGDDADLYTRWPEPRLLDQCNVWVDAEGTSVPLGLLDGPSLLSVLAQLDEDLDLWHRVAAADELARLSSAVGWAYRQTGVWLIGSVDPGTWLESTPFVRRVRALLAGSSS